MRRKNAKTTTSGFALIATISVLFVLLMLTLFLYVLLMPSIKIGSNFFDNAMALYNAEAGVARLLSTIRNTNPPLPNNLGQNITLALVVDDGFFYSDTVVVANNGIHQYSADVFGMGGREARRVSTVIFNSFNAPNATDGTVCAYGDNYFAIVISPAFVSGDDHMLPSDFACRANGCISAGLGASNGVVATYNSSSGGMNSKDGLLELVNYIRENNIAVSAHVSGIRESPLITVVPPQQTLVLETDGAGLLIVNDASTLFFATGVHYEGFVIVLGSGKIAGNASNYIYGSLVFVNPPAGGITFNGTQPGVLYSAAAIYNLKKLNTFLTKTVSIKMFSS